MLSVAGVIHLLFVSLFIWKLRPSPDAIHASEILDTLFSELSSAYAAQSEIPGLFAGHLLYLVGKASDAKFLLYR